MSGNHTLSQPQAALQWGAHKATQAAFVKHASYQPLENHSHTPPLHLPACSHSMGHYRFHQAWERWAGSFHLCWELASQSLPHCSCWSSLIPCTENMSISLHHINSCTCCRTSIVFAFLWLVKTKHIRREFWQPGIASPFLSYLRCPRAHNATACSTVTDSFVIMVHPQVMSQFMSHNRCKHLYADFSKLHKSKTEEVSGHFVLRKSVLPYVPKSQCSSLMLWNFT